MKFTGEQSQLYELIVEIHPASQNMVFLLSKLRKISIYLLSCKCQKLSLADLSRIGFWFVLRITWDAGEPGSEIGGGQGD